MPVSKYAADPDGDDLKTWLLGTGLLEEFTDTAAVSLDYDGVTLGAVSDWKRATGYNAGFLASANDVTLTYYRKDMVNGCMKMLTGLVSLTSLTAAGTELTEGDDFILEPRLASVSGEPFKRVEFLGYCPGFPLAITGKIGYAAEYPPEVWNIILARAAQNLFPQLGLQISGGVAALKADDVALQFVRSSGGRDSAGGPLSQERDTIQTLWRTMVRQFCF